MLPRRNKLTVNGFNQIPSKAGVFQNLSYLVKIKKQRENNGPKFAIIVPKYLDKRSSKRHLTRRIIEEAIRPKINTIDPSLYILIKTKRIFDKKTVLLAAKELDILTNKKTT